MEFPHAWPLIYSADDIVRSEMWRELHKTYAAKNKLDPDQPWSTVLSKAAYRGPKGGLPYWWHSHVCVPARTSSNPDPNYMGRVEGVPASLWKAHVHPDHRRWETGKGKIPTEPNLPPPVEVGGSSASGLNPGGRPQPNPKGEPNPKRQPKGKGKDKGGKPGVAAAAAPAAPLLAIENGAGGEVQPKKKKRRCGRAGKDLPQ